MAVAARTRTPAGSRFVFTDLHAEKLLKYSLKSVVRYDRLVLARAICEQGKRKIWMDVRAA
ncbi:hypothetical protein PMI08_03554, partial [Brevibacillus sp. CF112]